MVLEECLRTLELNHGIFELHFPRGNISDVSALSGLTRLRELDLTFNSISDIGPLSGLTSLMNLFLSSNSDLTDIQPLLDNAGLGAGDTVSLLNVNPAMPCAEVAQLRNKGVLVIFNVCT